jgi:4-methylaminobutanoate oxidase (formaldehyde-forming)
MISKISKDDFSSENFPFGFGKSIKINEISVWAQRLSYVGELGYELYIDSRDAKNLYKILIEEGKNFELSHCGMHAMDIMRMESGFVHWGHDISPEENQYEAGLKFAISYKKNVNFVGKEALIKIKDKKPKKQLMMFVLQDNKPGEPLLLHEEPIYFENKIIGRTTSGNYSFCYNKNLFFGYVNSENSYETLKNKKIFIEVEKKKYPVTILEKPLNQKNYKN